ncbi:MAG TPA: sensor histidine kinase KdpD [Candidatus Sulfotelmatobacter sp.]|nr:sensor histidine kinase KdpD [Candidatus Sulfotelmatobacter sp.]
MNRPSRPDPDILLKRLHHEEHLARRAKLKIFFGASAGVGKTFAMLVEAHERKRSGTDVVVGLVETHGRRETEALLDGLDVVPRLDLDYRGTRLTEFDLDGALRRRPALLLVDELAHTNAPGSRHARRWQDVLELLDAGIEVYTTLNVQHVESLNDVVAQITGITVRETVPDSVIDRADEIELVDLPPDDLLQRLREGKVYVPDQAARATESFFRKGNLIALRELALRQTAQRVDAQMESYRLAQGIAEPWPVRERILVCIGNPESGVRLVRSVRRMAAALKAEWIAVHVETPGQVGAAQMVRDHIIDVMGLAEDLGAETNVLTGLRVSDEILAFARVRNVSRIVVGKPSRPRWQELLFGSLVNTLVRDSGDVDVYVMRGEEDETEPALEPRPPRPIRWRGYAGSIPIALAFTLVAFAMYGHFDLSNIAMVYLLGVVVAAAAFGRGPAFVTALLSVGLFDFLFVPPRYTFAVHDTEYIITFGVMLVVGAVIGSLTARKREQTEADRQLEGRSSALYHLSRELAARRGVADLMQTAVSHVSQVFDSRVAILLPGPHDRVEVGAGDRTLFGNVDHERGVAQWAFDHAQPAGLGTPTLPGSAALHLPLIGSEAPVGILAVRPADPQRLRDPERIQLLRTFANQIALALERARLVEQAERAEIEVEAERTRNALLSSVSHDLRTPLAAILGAATSLRDDAGRLPAETRHELADTIADEATHLNRLVGDLLDVTRLESGALPLHRDWHSVQELVGVALGRLEAQIGSRVVRLDLSPELPLVSLDDVLFGQVLINLIENALRYSPESSPIEISARIEGGELVLEVADRGPGLPPGEESKVFDKFYRGDGPAKRGGVGLGLTISRGIVEAHDGTLTAENRPGGGACFRIRLPASADAPLVEPESRERS